MHGSFLRLAASSQPGLAAIVLALASCAHAASGGPDAFGYTFVDSLDPAGPTYMGVDISLTGASLPGGNDVSSGPIMLARPFDFYGVPLTSVMLSSNGYLSSDPASAGDDSSNDCPLPAVPSSGGGARIYNVHDDLVTTTFFHEYQSSCARPADRGTGIIGCTIFQWDDVTHAGGGGPWDMWVILYDNGDIVCEVGPGNPEIGSFSTNGIQDATASTGLSAACNAPGSVPASYAVLFQYPCDQAMGAGGLAPPTTSLVVTSSTTINAATGTINGTPDVAYRGNGIFSFIDITIQAGATLDFAGATGPDLRASGTVVIDGTIDLAGTTGNPGDNNAPGGLPVAGVAGGGYGGEGACGTTWTCRYGQRGGGANGGFAGTHPVGTGGFADGSGGGGGGNGTAGVDGDPDAGVEPGRGGCASLSPLVSPVRGGGGGGGGGCDVDAGTPTAGGSNDGGGGGGSGGGGILIIAQGNLTVGATGTINANGGNGGISNGNGGSGGGGAGGTVVLMSMADLTHGGSITATGGPGGGIGQPGATSAGGAGGAGAIFLLDSDGVIAGAGTTNPAATTGVQPGFNPLRITNIDLPNASPGGAYMATITAAGGSGSYTYAVTAGMLPGGLTLDPMTGIISGSSTTTAGLRDEFTVQVDDGTTTAERGFCVLTSYTPLTLTTDTLPGVDPGMPYSEVLTWLGGTGTTAFSIVSGALPTGLSLNTSTGAITGTAGMLEESATFSVKVRSAIDQSDTQTYIIDVGGGAGGGITTFTPNPLPAAEECSSYMVVLSGAGGTPPYSFEMVDGALPSGLIFDPIAGSISGAAASGSSAASPYQICLYVYDAIGLLSYQSVSLAVDPPTTPPSCTILVEDLTRQDCSTPALGIPDNDPLGVSDMIVVPQTGVIQGLTVSLLSSHTRVGDLHVELTHMASGVTAVLMDRPGLPGIGPFGCENDNVNVIFSDVAGTSVQDVCATAPAISGMARPVDPLATFNGLTADTTWVLTVSDNAAGDTGTLSHWCLDLDYLVNPAAGTIDVDIEPRSQCDPAVDVVSFEYSLDGGVTFLGPCTPAATSPIVPPQSGVPSAVISRFQWNSPADMVASSMVEPTVVVRATISDGVGMVTCDSVEFMIDNQCLCGDCDQSGVLPPTIIDALVGAQISAGLVTPTALQDRCCDVDGTGSVSIIDSLIMAQVSAGLGAPLACP